MKIQLPENKTIEAQLLGCMLNSLEAYETCIAESTDDIFYHSDHKQIFVALKACSTGGMHDVAHWFEINKIKFDLSYLASIACCYEIGMPWEDYLASLLDYGKRRKTIYILNDAYACLEKENFNVVHDKLTSSLLKIASNSPTSIYDAKDLVSDIRDGRSVAQEAAWRRDQKLAGKLTYEGLSSGYRMFDTTLGGLQNGCLYLVGARTSMGKTTFMLNLVNNILMKHAVGIFSLEMPARILLEKLYCIKSEVQYASYASGYLNESEVETIESLEKYFKQVNLLIDDESGLTINKLASKAKRMKQKNDIKVLFIDYLTLIKSTGNHQSKHLAVDEISKGLQALSKELGIPIVCLAQLNREAARRDGNRPALIDFRESGSIEEDADACILLHRPEYYKTNEKPGIVECIIAKNRIMGSIRSIDFHCNADRSERYFEHGETTRAPEKPKPRFSA